jgi:hypothetical protein
MYSNYIILREIAFLFYNPFDPMIKGQIFSIANIFHNLQSKIMGDLYGC